MPGSYHIPTTNLIEPGCINKTGEWAAILGGKKAFIVSSLDQYGKKQGEMVQAILLKSNINSILFAGAGPNPSDGMVMEGASEYKSNKCDLIIAIGGGSAIDCAKGIGLVVSHDRHISEFEGINKSQKPIPHFIAINTTSGTGSEVSSIAVITNSTTEKKITIVDWRITPDVSINDAELALSMPKSLTAASGIDAFSHAIEAMVANNSTPITDALSFEAIQIITEWLPLAFDDGKNLQARSEMCHGSFLAGIAFNNSGLGLVHALSHPVTSMYGYTHGVVNAILLPAVIKFNINSSIQKYSRVATAMNAGIPWHSDYENAKKVIPAVIKLIKRLGFPNGLKELGVKEDDIAALSILAEKEIVGLTNPKKANISNITQLYHESLSPPKIF